jgi:adenine-specific DNA-methyltransferase
MLDFEKLSREDLIKLLTGQQEEEQSSGIRLTYPGQTAPWQIVRRVQPRGQRIDAKFSAGDENAQAANLIVEGENLQALVSLYKYRGQVDLVLTDPPYNTGQDFRYNDRWDEDPNDPDLGKLVPSDDGSRHSKWLRFMTPRLWMMREALRPGGVLAICIDHRELFRLGMLLDSLFGESNRIAIINWQKSYAPRNDHKHVSTATEYVLVYAKNVDRAGTTPLPRRAETDARYGSPDGDPEPWAPVDLSAQGDTSHPTMVYAIQSPFTGLLNYPSATCHWRAEKKRMKAWLEAWGSSYIERDIGDGKAKALLIKGAPLPEQPGFDVAHPVLAKALAAAEVVRDSGAWPMGYWRSNGYGAFRMKRYLKDVKQGVVPTTYWADEDYEEPLELGSTSWEHNQSGHSQAGLNELSAIVGRDHSFDTVKPMRLFKKIIQIWCPPTGIVLDPFAGSGTSGHAVLELNAEAGANRRFVLIEQGRPERGDPYARSLTAERVRRAISGQRATGNADPLPGGFRFSKLTAKVDAAAILALQREEMIDLLLTSHWDQAERASAHLHRLPAGAHQHLFAKSGRGEGYFLVWNGPDQASVLNREAFRTIVAEAQAEGLTHPFHVYARRSTYSGPNVEFYQIPNRILEKLGFNEALHFYGTGAEPDRAAEDAA